MKQFKSLSTKCVHGHNHDRVRDLMINNRMMALKCLGCSEFKTLDHATKCREIRELRV